MSKSKFQNMLRGSIFAFVATLAISTTAQAAQLWVFVPNGQFDAYTSMGECKNAKGKCKTFSSSCGGRNSVILSTHTYNMAISSYKSGARVNVVVKSNNKKLCSFKK